MNIASCLDDNYAMPCGVLFVSICENNKDQEIVFYVLSEKLKEENKKTLEKIVAGYGQHICFYTIDPEPVQHCPFQQEFQTPFITLSTYYRLLLSSTLPDNVDKVLYLDCDTIVCGELKELWNTVIDDYAIAAVSDCFGDSIVHYNRLNYDFSLGYFNAGVLLINLNCWRHNNIERKLLEYIRDYPETLEFYDQDALNYILREQKKELPIKYNLTSLFLWKTRYLLVKKSRWEEVFAAIKAPVIVHYTISPKPWHKDSAYLLNHVWLEYYKMSPWKNVPLRYKRTFMQRSKSILRNILVCFKILAPAQSKYRTDLFKKS